MSTLREQTVLPSFFALGPQKSGTTWLHERLAEHPGIYVPRRVKETFFFDRYFARGLDWYARYFDEAPQGAVAGEVAPTYFGDAQTPSRIAQTVPHAKLIVTLRNPADRAWSMYLHHWRKGDTRAPFAQAVEEFPRILEDGLFARHLARYRENFPPGNIHILDYDEMEAAPEGALSAVFAFIGADPGFRCAGLHARANETEEPRSHAAAKIATAIARRLHASGLHEVVGFAKSLGASRLLYGSGRKPDLYPSQQDREKLIAYYAADMEALDAMLGKPVSARWRNQARGPRIGND